MKKPLRIKNFMSEEDIELFKDYMDKNYLSWHVSGEKIFTRRFGKDNLYNPINSKPVQHGDSFVKMENIEDMESDLIKNLMIKYSKKLEEEIKAGYQEDSNLCLSEFWICKRIKGAYQPVHSDIDSGNNSQIKYSGIIYLSTMFIGGEIFFPHINYTYTPKAGEVIVFPSRDRDFDHGVNLTPNDRYTLPIWLSDNMDYALVK